MLYSSMVHRWGSEDNENCFLLTGAQVWPWSTKLIIAALWWVVVCAVGLQFQLAFVITWCQYLFDTKREFYAQVSCFSPSFYQQTHQLNSVFTMSQKHACQINLVAPAMSIKSPHIHRSIISSFSVEFNTRIRLIVAQIELKIQF
mgnify:CR=1 FL=1